MRSGKTMQFEKIGLGEAESVMVPMLQLDPARIRIWKGNARVYERLTGDNTRDLIDSIDASGQQFPAVVRPLYEDADYDYELTAGSRRHFAISWLRVHGRSDLRLMAQISNVDDESAFQLSDAENRVRQDVSDLERARNYAWALEAIYGGALARMADSMKVSKSWLSKTISVSKIPDDIIAAFNSPSDVKIKPAYALAQALADKQRASRIREIAGRLAKDQARQRERGRPPMSAPEVIGYLLERKSRSDVAFWRSSETGAIALTLASRTSSGLSIRVHPHTGASHEELVAAFREALAYMDGPA